MYFKWQKAEAVRSRDRKTILERVEQAKEMREARFKRLLSSVAGEGTLAQDTAKTLRDRSEYEEQRRRGLHEEWQNNVHWPLNEQADRHLNPPNRALEQQRSGIKSVGWNLPEDEFKIKVMPHQDPNRRLLADHARDNAFHQTAEQLLVSKQNCMPQKMLARSQSAPQLQAGQSSVIPRARSREVLDPTVWSQHRIQGTLYGFWAQTAEHGEGFRRAIRGGADAHIPDETDGVMVAGSRMSRTHGYHDKGILKGERASRGEAAEHKQHHGSSSGVPAQDHFNFERGTYITDLEFPKGKRGPPPGTLR